MKESEAIHLHTNVRSHVNSPAAAAVSEVTFGSRRSTEMEMVTQCVHDSVVKEMESSC